MQHLDLLRQKDPKETKKIPLNFIAYTFGYIKKNNFKNINLIF